MLSERQQFVLAALASADRYDPFSPVDVQKLFFLLDREAAALHGGEKFSFEPYDYGPFDKEVYDEVDALSAMGLVEIDNTGRYRKYRLTPDGMTEGKNFLSSHVETLRDYMSRVANWVLDNDFNTVVSSIYKAHPDMKAKSIFRG